MEQDTITAEAAQSHAAPQQSSSMEQTNEPAADLVEQELADANYIEGRLDIDETRKRFYETSCTVEEKEVSDLFKKGLLEDGSTGPLKGDFTCSVQWKTSKRKLKDKTSRSSPKNSQETTGLTDDELASVLQACPDLDGFITKS
jgi:hypothetical protein